METSFCVVYFVQLKVIGYVKFLDIICIRLVEILQIQIYSLRESIIDMLMAGSLFIIVWNVICFELHMYTTLSINSGHDYD